MIIEKKSSFLYDEKYIVKIADENFIPRYFDWVKSGFNEDLDESKFLSLFNFDENLKAELMKLINNIIKSRAK